MEKHIKNKIERYKKVFDMSQDKERFLFQIEINDDKPVCPPLRKDNIPQRLDYIKRFYEYQVKKSAALDDDSIPYLNMVTGTEIFGEACGCEVFFPENNNPCAVHYLKSAKDSGKVKIPPLYDSTLMYLFDMADELKKFAGKDCLFKLPDLQSPMDIVALIWEKVEFFCALVEEPETIKEMSRKVKALVAEFLEEWFKRYGKAFIAHFPDYYMEEGATMSVDEVGLISPETFKEFFLDELNDLSDKFGGIGIHCCADSEHQFDNFKSVRKLRLINLYRGRDAIIKSYSVFEKKCVQYPGLIINGVGGQLGFYDYENYPKGNHMIFREYVSNMDEALKLCDKLKKVKGRAE